MFNYSERDVDIATRTVIGEASGQGDLGQQAVAHVLKNRLEKGGFGKNISAVALQPLQFSTWNKGVGGNKLPYKYKPGDSAYDRARENVLKVFNGARDPTGGALYYYSPAGMKALQKINPQRYSDKPSWWNDAVKKSGGDEIQIGGHIFAGDKKKVNL